MVVETYFSKATLYMERARASAGVGLRMLPLFTSGVSEVKRIGLIYGPLVPYDDIVYGARLAEQIGLESAWVSEAWGADGFVVATNLASITERVRIGLGIANVYTRTPSAIAMGISTLDMISKGRAMLGLGVSARALFSGESHRARYLQVSSPSSLCSG